jgi:signal transduction histidine kinase
MKEAFGLLDAGSFDVILTDLFLPDSGSEETFINLQRRVTETPIVILTSRDDEKLALDLVERGAQDYIVKGTMDIKFLPRILCYAVLRKKMELELKKSKEELEIQAWGLKKTNEGIKVLYKELEKKNDQLKQLDTLKSQFVANVSHEFKNPLAAIQGALSIILDGLVGEMNTEQTEMITMAKNNIERLTRLVTDLLDLSKIESGKMEMRREEIDIAVLINEVISEYKHVMAEKKIIFEKDIPEDIETIWADRDKMKQVIINILGNAIKYTPERETVSIKLSSCENEVHFEVSDTGPGIAGGDLEKIFDKFERVTIEKQEGTGLGLPIAKDIIELHKGRVRVESEIGKGSVFFVDIPRDLRR